jgi:hypothetical protein
MQLLAQPFNTLAQLLRQARIEGARHRVGRKVRDQGGLSRLGLDLIKSAFEDRSWPLGLATGRERKGLSSHGDGLGTSGDDLVVLAFGCDRQPFVLNLEPAALVRAKRRDACRKFRFEQS